MNEVNGRRDRPAHGQGRLSRRELFRSLGAAALGGLALSVAPVLRPARALAHEEEGEASLVIHMGEMYFKTHEGEENAPIHVKAGEELILLFENVGTVEHEAHFGIKPFQDDGRFAGYEEDLFDGFLGLELQPGEKAKLHIQIPEDKVGEWEIGCFIPGHYEAGMHAPFVVE